VPVVHVIITRIPSDNDGLRCPLRIGACIASKPTFFTARVVLSEFTVSSSRLPGMTRETLGGIRTDEAHSAKCDLSLIPTKESPMNQVRLSQSFVFMLLAK
jgi:hypothetical protein